MRYISLFSGIEAASVAFKPLGWEPVAFSEVDEFASAVLHYNYPDVPNVSDICKEDWNKWNADLVIGGSPCQAFSMAGLRKGLNDERGNLTLEYARTINAISPRVFIWENVKGVLSDSTNAFGCLLYGLLGIDGELQPDRGRKWGNTGFLVGDTRAIAWRIFDSQYWGVPQRRKRVYLVGVDFRDFRGLSIEDSRRQLGGLPAAVLFIPRSQGRDTEESEETRGKVATSVRTSLDYFCGNPWQGYREGMISQTLTTEMKGQTDLLCFSSKDKANDVSSISPTLRLRNQPAITDGSYIRKFTPIEVERLQGFPDSYTDIPYRNGRSSKTSRYKVLGNSMTVPVVRWIGEQINYYLPQFL